ncbi:BT4734/BF3469 family protein [Parabacteroides merdae]|uniref:VirE protein n=1 Tax=Parabacteroides merdae TaxID=46503 RepID=A0A7K1HHK3_9BACT|nr:BT4734/BF3469 family protein [Parabacteroides merdae]MTU30694.1 hypothetical protein [Parabacteroides merdae]RYS82571.1 hypothetical protein EAJ15_16115 [Parabacteroides merdae]
MKPNLEVSIFRCKKNKASVKTVDIQEWLLQRNEYTLIVEKLRETDDDDERKRLKSSLPAITVSGVFSKRRADCLLRPSNLICIDIDGKDNPSISDMEVLKASLAKLSYVMYCGLSASGNGLFCIIPYDDFGKHKLYFNALQQEFKDMGIIIDSSCSDICRLRFYSYDEHPYVNWDAEVYTHTVEKTNIAHLKSKEVFSKRSSDIQISNENPRALSIEEALLQPSNLDFASATPLSKTEEAERLLNLVIERQIDITPIFNDWIKIGLVIKNLFGGKGLDLFLQVSSFHPKYSQEEAESKYFELNEKKYKTNTQSLFEIAAKYGIYH